MATAQVQDRPTDRVGERLVELRESIAAMQAAKDQCDEEQIAILFREDARPGDQQKLAKRSADLGRQLSDAREQLARVQELHDIALREAAKAELAELAVLRRDVSKDWQAAVKRLRAAVAEVGRLSEAVDDLGSRDAELAQQERRASERGQVHQHTAGALPYATVFDRQALPYRLAELDAALSVAATRE